MKYIFIDESGTDHFADTKIKNVHFSLCSSIIDANEYETIDKRFKAFKQKYSQLLNSKITYLHDREIEDGIQRGKGLYSLLNNNKTLRNQFLKEFTSLLTEPNFQLVSIVFNLIEYKVFMLDYVRSMNKRNKNFHIKFETGSMYMMSLLFLLINLAQLTQDQECKLYTEQKTELSTMDQRFLDALLLKTFYKRSAALYLNIPKGTEEYTTGLEIADLCANPLRKQFENSNLRTREREIILPKVLINKETTVKDFIKALGVLDGTPKQI